MTSKYCKERRPIKLNVKKPAAEQPLRYRVTVPLQDTDVINWITAQANPSFSIRTLIRAYITKYGITDATCLPAATGIDIEISNNNPETNITQTSQTQPKKSHVSLTDIRQGHVQIPTAQPVQQAPAKPVQTATPVTPAQTPPAPVPTQPEQPAQNQSQAQTQSLPPGYTVKEIYDLL